MPAGMTLGPTGAAHVGGHGGHGEPRSEWRPVSGALATSLVLHAITLASLAAILAPLPTGDPHAAPGTPIAVRLLPAGGAADRPASASPPTIAIEPQPLPGTAAAMTPGGLAIPRTAPGSQLPWSGLPVDNDLPAPMLGSAMTPQGVEFYETRNLAILGVDVEGKIAKGFGSEPDRPIQLRADAVIGYPLDALAQGIEGTVVVWFVVDADGEVVERQAVSGPPELADFVLKRLGSIVDLPAYDKGRPVRAWMALEVTFSREAAQATAPVPPSAAEASAQAAAEAK